MTTQDKSGGKTIKLCSCNKTMSVDAAALGKALGIEGSLKVHDALCRRQAGAFSDALSEPDVIVACTQEAQLFSELAAQQESESALRFVNVRGLAQGFRLISRLQSPER